MPRCRPPMNQAPNKPTDMLPDDARERVAAHAGHHGIRLEPAQIEQLLGHLSLLAKWNKVYNLTALRDPGAMLQHHLLDSLALVAPLQRYLGSDVAARLLDVGSGAGFPGLTVATAMPTMDVVCVDSVGKKVGFIRQVIGEIGLRNARGEQARVEQLGGLECRIVTSRAFASLADFVKLTRRHLAADGCWVAMKGQHPVAELAELPADVDVFHVEQLDVPGLDAQRCLIWMRPRGS